MNKHSQDNWKTKYKTLLTQTYNYVKAPMIFDGQNRISTVVWLSKYSKIKDKN